MFIILPRVTMMLAMLRLLTAALLFVCVTLWLVTCVDVQRVEAPGVVNVTATPTPVLVRPTVRVTPRLTMTVTPTPALTPTPTPTVAPAPVTDAPVPPVPVAAPRPPDPTPTPLRDPFAWWDTYLGYHDARLDAVVIRSDWENVPSGCLTDGEPFGCRLENNIWLNLNPTYWYDRTSVIGHELGHVLDFDDNAGPKIMWYANWTGYDIWCSVIIHC